MTTTKEIAAQLQTNMTALTDTTQTATPTLFQDVIIGPPPHANREKIVLADKELGYITFGGGNEFEYEYQASYTDYKIPAIITVYLPGSGEVAHQRGMDLIDIFLDMLSDDPTLTDKCGGVYVTEMTQGALDDENNNIEVLQFMLTIQR